MPHGGLILPPFAVLRVGHTRKAAVGGGGGGSTARYWQFYVTATVGGIAGVGANTLAWNIGGVDQTGSGTASASSDLGFGFTADLAFNGDNSDRWVSDFTNTWPQTLTYDFGSALAITSMRLVGNADGAGPSDFLIRSSPDNATWTVEKTVAGLTGTDWTGVNHVGGTGLGLTFTIP